MYGFGFASQDSHDAARKAERNICGPGFSVTSQQLPTPGGTAVLQACMEHAGAQYGTALGRVGLSGDDDAWPAEQQDPEALSPERQQLVKQALREPITHFALLNPFLAQGPRERVRAALQLQEQEEPLLPDAVYDCPPTVALSGGGRRGPQADFRAAAAIGDGEDAPLPRPAAALRASPEAQLPVLPCCYLAGAAALAAHALGVRPGERVLDLCAGPGAKSLVLATLLFGRPWGAREGQPGLLEQMGVEAGVLAPLGEVTAGAEAQAVEDDVDAAVRAAGCLVCNEPQRQRAALLEELLAAFVPSEVRAELGSRLQVTRAEASEKAPLALQRLGPFDRVLVDPPCTSVRAGAKAPAARQAQRRGASEEAAEVKRTAAQCEVLLRCGAALVRPGGVVVYCTTSLEERENGEVVRRFLRRTGNEFELEPGEDDVPISGCERVAMGTSILPDQGTLHGPLYWARLRRRGGAA